MWTSPRPYQQNSCRGFSQTSTDGLQKAFWREASQFGIQLLCPWLHAFTLQNDECNSVHHMLITFFYSINFQLNWIKKDLTIFRFLPPFFPLFYFPREDMRAWKHRCPDERMASFPQLPGSHRTYLLLYPLSYFVIVLQGFLWYVRLHYNLYTIMLFCICCFIYNCKYCIVYSMSFM